MKTGRPAAPGRPHPCPYAHCEFALRFRLPLKSRQIFSRHERRAALWIIVIVKIYIYKAI